MRARTVLLGGKARTYSCMSNPEAPTSEDDRLTVGDTIDINNILLRVEDIDRGDDVKRATLIEECGPHGLIEDPEHRELVEVNGDAILCRPDDTEPETLPECADVAEEAEALAGITDGPDDAEELVTDAQHILNTNLGETAEQLVIDAVKQELGGE